MQSKNFVCRNKTDQGSHSKFKRKWNAVVCDIDIDKRTCEIEVTAIKNGRLCPERMQVYIEESFIRWVNDRAAVHPAMTPADPEAFATGYLISEGLVSDPDEIKTRDVDGRDVRVTVSPDGIEISSIETEIRSSGCRLSTCIMACTGRMPSGMVLQGVPCRHSDNRHEQRSTVNRD